jgi:hypothetical protein
MAFMDKRVQVSIGTLMLVQAVDQYFILQDKDSLLQHVGFTIKH